MDDRARLAAHLDAAAAGQIERLGEFVRFASVSADPAAGPAVAACVEWLVGECRDAGFDDVRAIETSGNPIVVARLRSDRPGALTVLVYGHYDVQPADPAEWQTPPFIPDVRDGCIYARGISDNKAPILVNLSAVRACRELYGAVPCNLTYVIEGDEERSAEPLRELAASHGDLLAADVLHVADSWMHDHGVPAVTTALRGMAAIDVAVSTARWNLHSGIYGGAVPNAVAVLARLLAGLHDERGRVAVAGFYDRVQEASEAERAGWQALEPDPEAYLADSGARYLAGEASYSTIERLWARPTLEINGVWGGYTGEGIHTIVPAEAHAKITCRLVPDQDPQETLDQIATHLRRHLPAGAKLTIESTLAGCAPLSMPADSPAVRAAASALAEVWGRPAVVGRAGYSVPAAETLAVHTGGKALLMGFALAGERAHGPDEHFHLENLRKGIEATVGFWNAYAAAARQA